MKHTLCQSPIFGIRVMYYCEAHIASTSKERHCSNFQYLQLFVFKYRNLSQSAQNKFGVNQVITHPRKVSTRGRLRAIEKNIIFSTRKLLLENTRATYLCKRVFPFHIILAQCCHQSLLYHKPIAKATRKV